MRTRRNPGPKGRPLEAGLQILHEDKDILVVDKPAGLLTIATPKERVQTAYFILTQYVRAGSPKSRERIFIVHRIDRDTSGVLLFAKTPAAKFRLQDGWAETKKHYLAAVHGRLAKKSDTITSYLAENRVHRVYSTHDTKKGKLSRTAYRVLREAKGMTLLDVEPLTGRKNQIRVHLADIGHPVVGDKKYGRDDGPRTRLALHARSISFPHPTSGKWVTLESSVPPFFTRLFGHIDP
jgi:tRNA pseudouridine32 synthase/23S rRNA pseudouridine746 synthase/23S rRNA pseudouridine1911/1915/1917 synthase